MKKVLFIYSPDAGEKRVVSKLDYIISLYQKHGYILVAFRYTSKEDINDAMKLVDQSIEYILIAGGDGTVNRVVSAMVKNNIELPIATIPSGTANDFARMLGYNSSIRIACEQIIFGDVQTIDLGKANDDYFVNVLSTGLFTDVSQKTPTYLKNTFGKLAYYVGGVQELPNFNIMKVKLKNETVYIEDNALIIFVFNGKTAGNIKLAQKSDVADGLLDVVIIKGDNLAESIQTVFHFISGSKKSYPKGVIHLKTESINIDTLIPIQFDIDGEQGPTSPLEIRCIKNGLRVIVPEANVGRKSKIDKKIESEEHFNNEA